MAGSTRYFHWWPVGMMNRNHESGPSPLVGNWVQAGQPRWLGRTPSIRWKSRPSTYTGVALAAMVTKLMKVSERLYLRTAEYTPAANPIDTSTTIAQKPRRSEFLALSLKRSFTDSLVLKD